MFLFQFLSLCIVFARHLLCLFSISPGYMTSSFVLHLSLSVAFSLAHLWLQTSLPLVSVKVRKEELICQLINFHLCPVSYCSEGV